MSQPLLVKKLSVLSLAGLTSLVSTPGYAQNLLANGGFEIYSSLPTNYGQSDLATGWSNVNGNYSGSPFGSPDYAHALGFNGGSFAPLPAPEGDGQMGFTAWHSNLQDFREYISCGTITPLVPGTTYNVSFYLSGGGTNSIYTYGCDHVGLVFSTITLNQSQSEVIDAEPQIEIADVADLSGLWQYYSFSFTPTEPYQRITIGNFRLDSETTTTAEGTIGAYYFIDGISVAPAGAVGLDGTSGGTYALFPNPSTGMITITSPRDLSDASIIVTDAAGQEVLRQRGLAAVSMPLDLSALPAGCYTVSIRTGGATRSYQVLTLGADN